MTTDFKSAIRRATPALLGLLLLASSCGAQDPPAPDDDPVIYDWEIVAPATNSTDGWGGSPPPWFEDPASVDCGGREACQTSLENQTGEAS